ncbi:virion structural protein [Erwinia phage vB_EamM_Caitlin]|uniref:virion structural protein n=1 Tax=Erwinia phage vB_EamM_Caitlin TaxID=1883379 RepID=UPI00081CD3DB|nr:virion structural protein [Erwinia phage vB_EamM_Caitlin]ANZ48443.1 putative virion structural protein [Erwinia phage vB_EamM_Caitlin]
MLLDAINRQNNLTAKPLTWNQIASGYPEEVLTPGADRNTRVLLYGLNGQGYRGNVTIEYDRILMSVLFRNVIPVVIANPVQNVSQLLPALNAKYGLSLVASDIDDFSVASMGENWIADVSIKPGCLAWKGTFKLRYAKFFPNLADAVTDQALLAIIPPFTVSAKPQGEYVAYGYDWTNMTQQFGTDWAYNRALTADDVDLLNEVVPLKFGYVTGATAQTGQIALQGARFMGTAAVTPGDQYDDSFQRVAIIKLAADSNYAGNLILHYQPI